MTFWRRPVVRLALAAVGVTTSSNVDLAVATGTCGNGVLEAGEVCDDGNTAPIAYASGDFCAADCSPGGVDLTGQRCSDDGLQEAFASDERPDSIGSLVRFPPNSTVRLCDCDGNGVAVPVGPSAGHRNVLIEGQGVHLIFDPPTNESGCNPAPVNEVTVIEVGASSSFSTLRDVYVASAQGKAKVGIDATIHRLLLHNVFVDNMVTGISVDGDIRNANGAAWQNVVVTNSDNGVALDGSDSAGSLFRGLEIVGYTGVGLKAHDAWSTAHVGHNIGPSSGSVMAISDYWSATHPDSKQHGVLLGISVDGDDAVQLNGSFRTTVGGNLVARPEVGGQRVGAENANLSFQGPSGVETFDIRIPNANELQGVFSVGIRDGDPWFLARKLSPKQYSLYRPRGPEIDLMSWRDATLTGVGNVILGAPSSPGSNLCEVVSQCW